MAASKPRAFGFFYLFRHVLRRKRQDGTRARATSQLKTLRQVMNKAMPPTQSKVFKISACGVIANNSKLISAAESNCSSAGSRLVVVRKYTVLAVMN
jgi:hypothetical protein